MVQFIHRQTYPLERSHGTHYREAEELRVDLEMRQQIFFEYKF